MQRLARNLILVTALVTSGRLLASIAGVPEISAQPTSVTVAVGATTTLSVSATGDAAMIFQWRKDGSPIDGATSPSLKLSNVQAADAGGYYVVVSEATGSATSSVAVVNVGGPASAGVPQINTQPPSVAVSAGTNVVLSVSVTSDLAVSYQWRKGGQPIDGATSPSLTLTNIQAADTGEYYVVVSEFTGSATSTTASLAFVAPPSSGVPQITIQPASIAVDLGAAATLSVTATGSLPLTYQWRKDGQPIDGATNSSLTLPSVQNSDVGNYYVTVSEASGSATSVTAVVAIAGIPRITTQPGSVGAAVGATVTLSVAATGDAPLTYQWWKDGVTVVGATGSTLLLTNVQPANAGSYNVVVSEPTGSVTSSDAVVTVGTAAPSGVPQITTQPISLVIPAGSTGTLSVTATGDAPFSYQWRKGGQPIDGATGATLVLANAQATDAGSYYVVVSESTGSVTSTTVTVSISAPLVPGVPQITAQPSSITAAAGSTVVLSVSAIGDAALTYQWQKNGSSIAGATGTTLILPDAQTRDSGSYTVIVSETTVSVTSSIATVLIAGIPQITVQPTSTTASLGTTVTLSVTATADTALTYQWRKDGAPIDGASSRTLTLSNVQLSDAGGYLVVVSQPTGSATSSTAVVTISVPPGLTLVPATQGAAVTLQVSPGVSSDTSLSYQWQLNGDPIAGAVNSSFTLPNLQPTDAGLYSTAVSNTIGRATSDPVIVGVLTASKVVGTGVQVAANIFSPSNNATFDQVLLSGPAATVTADSGQITRSSFIDLSDDIVQVELSGPGTLSLVLASPTGPALPVKYNQNVAYMRGHAGIVIIGATKDTNVSVFSVGRVTSGNPDLFKDGVSYDGVADIAFIAITSADGKFGGVRTADASYFATQGLTGIYAPGVTFTGPVYVGDVSASGAARPVLLLGGATGDTWITGGDLLQSNGQPMRVSGITQLKFMAGQNSHGVVLPAQNNKTILLQNGVDVTTAIVVNPGQ